MSEPPASAERQALFSGDPRWGTPVLGGLYLVGGLLIVGGALAFTASPLPPPNNAAIFATLGGAWVWASTLILRAATRRKGWVEVFPDKLVFRKDWRRVRELPWDQVTGYSLPKPGYLQVHARDELGPDPGLTIPTPSEAVRAEAVALLEGRGVHAA